MPLISTNIPASWQASLQKAGLIPARKEGGMGALIRRLLVEHAAKNGVELVDTIKPVGVRDDYAVQRLEK